MLNSFLRMLAFVGCLNLSSKYEVLIRQISKFYNFSYTFMWTFDIVVGCNFVAQNYIATWSYGGIFKCIMLMNNEPHVIFALLVNLKKSLMA